MLGTSILWFEFEWERRGSALATRIVADTVLASVTTRGYCHRRPATWPVITFGCAMSWASFTRSLEAGLEADDRERQAWLGDNLRVQAPSPGAADPARGDRPVPPSVT